MDLRRFFTRGLVFASPLVLWALLVVVVDPFNYFNLSHVIPERPKVENAAVLNTVMFNMLKEVHNPCENLIIGDSRVENYSVEQIEQLTGQRYFRLAANALKLNEAVDLFWFANQRKHVARVVFGINFNQYNEYAYANRVQSVEAVIRNPLLYIFDRSVAQALYYVVKASLTHEKAVISVPPMTQDDFWNYIVTVRGTEHYAKYRHPDTLQKRMKEMVEFAKAQGTDITFVVVPHHRDFQRRVADFGLLDESARFTRDLNELGVRVIDFDYPNEITSERANFRDPLHTTDVVTRRIVSEVFGGRQAIGRITNQPSVSGTPRSQL